MLFERAAPLVVQSFTNLVRALRCEENNGATNLSGQVNFLYAQCHPIGRQVASQRLKEVSPRRPPHIECVYHAVRLELCRPCKA